MLSMFGLMLAIAYATLRRKVIRKVRYNDYSMLIMVHNFKENFPFIISIVIYLKTSCKDFK